MSRQTDAAGPRAVLWDVDGTLLDSAEFHFLSWREALAKVDFEYTRELFRSTFGQRNDEILRGFFGKDCPASTIEQVSWDKEEAYRHLVRSRGIDLLPGVRSWLGRLRAAGWRQAVASSAPLLNIELISEVTGIRDCFDGIVSSEDVQRGKPDPQVFLIAAGRVGADPASCVVVEDAPAGITGARRAGMRTIGVCSTHSSLEADIVVGSLEDLLPQAFEELLDRAPAE